MNSSQLSERQATPAGRASESRPRTNEVRRRLDACPRKAPVCSGTSKSENMESSYVEMFVFKNWKMIYLNFF